MSDGHSLHMEETTSSADASPLARISMWSFIVLLSALLNGMAASIMRASFLCVRLCRAEQKGLIMANREKTSPRIASKASAVLGDPKASSTAKSVAASALSQAGARKETSVNVASKASKLMEDGRSNSANKSIAASVLTQTPGKKE